MRQESHLPPSTILLNVTRPMPWITLLGLDGSGKSTVVEVIEKQLSPTAVTVIHRQPFVVFRTSRQSGTPGKISHYAKPPHGLIKSVIKLMALVLDWHLGYWRTIQPARRRGILVITDRHALLDLIADPLRYRYGGPASLIPWAIRLVPMPDLIFLLDAPLPVLLARKQELSTAKAEELRSAYLQLMQSLPNGRTVNAAQPIALVATDLINYLVSFVEDYNA